MAQCSARLLQQVCRLGPVERLRGEGPSGAGCSGSEVGSRVGTREPESQVPGLRCPGTCFPRRLCPLRWEKEGVGEAKTYHSKACVTVSFGDGAAPRSWTSPGWAGARGPRLPPHTCAVLGHAGGGVGRRRPAVRLCQVLQR